MISVHIANWAECHSWNKSVVFYLYGAEQTGKFSTTHFLCAQHAIRLIYVDMEYLLSHNENPLDMLWIALREAALRKFAIYFDNFEFLLQDKKWRSIFTNELILVLNYFKLLIFIASQNFDEDFICLPIIDLTFHFLAATTQNREHIWKKCLANYKYSIEDQQLKRLANLATIGGRYIEHVAKKMLQNDVPPSMLEKYLEEHISHKTLKMAYPVYTTNLLKDIVLPDEQSEQLREIISVIKNYNKVMENWGFAQHKSLFGSALSVLFCGASGTGKTMAAGIVANSANMLLKRIDLSAIVSKYIGETEKNLANIFNETETSSTILFFDEADALFAKRTEVRDSHDRYANLEVSYLLQRIEAYEGIIILATNLRNNIDEAFIRRMQFVVHFPFPARAQRKLIWEKIYPAQAPLAKDIDFNYLAEVFELSGGNIKNIALLSAFFAIQDSQLLTMDNIIQAAKREYKKINKSFPIISNYENDSKLMS